MSIRKTIDKITKKHRRRTFKLGITYNVFDGVEFLPASVRSVRKRAGYINVVYQTISNFGEQAPSEDIKILEKLKSEKLIDKIIIYTPNLSWQPGKNETRKRNIGLQDCKKNRCTHFLNMDTDEFYRDSELKDAIDFIIEKNIGVSCCAQYFYIKEPIYRSKWPKLSTFVPFICKISRSVILNGSKDQTFCLVDPTRMVSRTLRKAWMFSPDKICMHHMQLVRKDFQIKFRNSSGNTGQDFMSQANEMERKIHDYQYPQDFSFGPNKVYEIIRCENEFNIDFSTHKLVTAKESQ